VISKARPSFWRCYAGLPEFVKEQSRQAYGLFRRDPRYPSLRFKKLRSSDNLWSVRISEQYRAVDVREGDTIEWIWIGSHAEFDKLFS